MIRRSLATTFITLLPVVALFLFGGATLKDFAFAIIVGIVVGAVSTIFIAAPILSTLWKSATPSTRGAATRRCLRALRRARCCSAAEAAAAAEPTPETPVDVAERVLGDGDGADDAAAKRERRRQRREVTAAWTTPVTTSRRADRSTGCWRCSGRGSTSCARCFDERGSRWRGDAVRVGEGTKRRVLGLRTRARPDHARGLGRARAARRPARAPAAARRGRDRRGTSVTRCATVVVLRSADGPASREIASPLSSDARSRPSRRS